MNPNGRFRLPVPDPRFPQRESSSSTELPATSSQVKALSWRCFPPFDSSPNGEPLIGERIRQVADFPLLAAGGWRLEANCSIYDHEYTDGLAPPGERGAIARAMSLCSGVQFALRQRRRRSRNAAKHRSGERLGGNAARTAKRRLPSEGAGIIRG